MIAGEEGLRESAAAEQAPLDQGRLATPSSGRADPGGRIVWAKVGAYPWWPAKVLNPGKDASFPPDEEPPRPNAIPVRFFGTYDFSWLGSKRAIMDWEEGKEQCLAECKQDSFLDSVAEVDEYRRTGVLPDEFYIVPVDKTAGRRKSGVGGKSRKSEARLAGTPVDVIAVTPALSPEERRRVVLRRRKQYLQSKGLIPPGNSPFRDGVIAVNPAVLAQQAAWSAGHPAMPPGLYNPCYPMHTQVKPAP